ncbi:MAG: DegT/DnrJ/EryC1/StrS family aminotransferase [Chloroflexota bacterium]
MNVSGEPLLSPLTALKALLPSRRPVGPGLSRLAGASFYALGREALATGLATAPDGAVLVPSFICSDAVDAIRASGREVRFYPVRWDLAPEWSWLRRNTWSDTAAFVLVHYFGFPSDITAARRFCLERKLLLVEDCAHGLLTSSHGVPLGWSGDVAVYSPRKFFPLPYGGALRVSHLDDERPAPDIPAPGPAPATGAGTIGRALAKTAVFRSGSSRLLRAFGGAVSDETNLQPSDAAGARAMDPLSRRLFSLSARNVHGVVRRRRENYARLATATRGTEAVTVFRTELPEEVCPWAFPISVGSAEGRDGLEARDDLLLTLLEEGIGAWIWPELPDEPPGEPFSRNQPSPFLLLPVHQGLRASHMDYVADTLAAWSAAAF